MLYQKLMSIRILSHRNVGIRLTMKMTGMIDEQSINLRRKMTCLQNILGDSDIKYRIKYDDDSITPQWYPRSTTKTHLLYGSLSTLRCNIISLLAFYKHRLIMNSKKEWKKNFFVLSFGRVKLTKHANQRNAVNFI
jgi:hypothetical protein